MLSVSKENEKSPLFYATNPPTLPGDIAGILYKAVCITLYDGTSWKVSVNFPATLSPLE
jgi:hypothetical protein